MSRSRKRLLAWRRPAVQTELPLPEPAAPAAEEMVVELAWWQRPFVVAALAGVAAVLLVITVVSQVGIRRERASAASFAAELKTATLRAPTRDQRLRIAPNPRSWSASPDAQIDWPEPPELIEIFLPVGYARFQVFAVTIDKADQGRMMVLQRVSPDSNGDLRISLNSSAFGPGEYRLRLQGYTWRGQRVDAGWVRLVVKSPPSAAR
jgi:membrane protein implicated in regulation of membrane protease activity